MTLEPDIEFNQLVSIIKSLPEKQFRKLLTELKGGKPHPASHDMEAFLLNAPTFSKKQIQSIAETRKGINQWRAK